MVVALVQVADPTAEIFTAAVTNGQAVDTVTTVLRVHDVT